MNAEADPPIETHDTEDQPPVPNTQGEPAQFVLYPWCLEENERFRPYQEIIEVTGEMECRGCGKNFIKKVNVRQAFEELQEFIIVRNPFLKSYAPTSWLQPSDDECCGCGQCLARPLIDQNVEHINWLFLFLEKQLGRCVHKALKYYCKKTKLHPRNKSKPELIFRMSIQMWHNWIERGQLLLVDF